MFLDDLFLYFKAQPNDYTSDQICIVTTLTYMADGTVGPWKEGITATTCMMEG